MAIYLKWLLLLALRELFLVLFALLYFLPFRLPLLNSKLQRSDATTIHMPSAARAALQYLADRKTRQFLKRGRNPASLRSPPRKQDTRTLSHSLSATEQTSLPYGYQMQSNQGWRTSMNKLKKNRQLRKRVDFISARKRDVKESMLPGWRRLQLFHRILEKKTMGEKEVPELRITCPGTFCGRWGSAIVAGVLYSSQCVSRQNGSQPRSVQCCSYEIRPPPREDSDGPTDPTGKREFWVNAFIPRDLYQTRSETGRTSAPFGKHHGCEH